MRNWLVLLVAAGALPAPAFASPAETGPVAIVRYGDLDLATRDGKAAFERRMRHAIKAVCDPPGPKTTESYENVALCTDQAWRDAARQIR